MDKRQEDVFAEYLIMKEQEWRTATLQGNPRAPVAQHNFAGHLRLAPSYYSDLKNAKYLPNQQAIKKIAFRLGDEAFAAAGWPLPMPDDWRLRTIAKLWSRLTEDDRQEIKEMAERMLKEGEQGGRAAKILTLDA